MMWLLRLYPRSWRERYGEELAELLRVQPWSLSVIVDVIAGAIDARLDPQPASASGVPATPKQKEGSPMVSRMMKFRCAGYGPEVTARDQWRAGGVMIGGTIVLTVLWMWAHVVYGDNPYIDAFSVMPFLTAFVLSMPLTSLKARSRAARALFVAACLSLLTLASLLVGFVTSRL